MRPENEKKYTVPKPSRRRRACDIIFLALLLIMFETVALAFVMFPRSEISELENRKLKEFPEFTLESWFDGSFTAEVSEWFTDTVPFRDDLMGYSKSIQELSGFSTGVKIYGPSKRVDEEESEPEKPAQTTSKPMESSPAESESNPEQEVHEETSTPATTANEGNKEIEAVDVNNPDDNFTVYNNGIAVVGNRGLMLYGGNMSVGNDYAEVINTYKSVLGADVNVYSMVIPTAAEFYATSDIAPLNGSQLKNINNIITKLSDDVKAVNVYTALAEHKDENIYMRTDHHWAAMGAYYAAREFAKTAGVDFLDISNYEMQTVGGYVGSLYNYTSSPELKNNPEDFNYFTTDKVEITTTYYNYVLDSETGGIRDYYPAFEADFFQKYSYGNGAAYCTYMGGDAKIVHVNTSTKNGRTLAILKDSFGNALPQFLFGSFENIYVIDMRYFTYNFPNFAKDKGITDVLFANNAFHAVTASTVTKYEKFLTQEDRAGLIW